MTHRVGPKGQVVIPKEIRDQLGIEPGDDITFWTEDGHVVLRPTRAHTSLRGRFRSVPLVEDLMEERRRDRERDDKVPR